jgi:hypothetical protein
LKLESPRSSRVSGTIFSLAIYPLSTTSLTVLGSPDPHDLSSLYPTALQIIRKQIRNIRRIDQHHHHNHVFQTLPRQLRSGGVSFFFLTPCRYAFCNSHYRQPASLFWSESNAPSENSGTPVNPHIAPSQSTSGTVSQHFGDSGARPNEPVQSQYPVLDAQQQYLTSKSIAKSGVPKHAAAEQHANIDFNNLNGFTSFDALWWDPLDNFNTNYNAGQLLMSPVHEHFSPTLHNEAMMPNVPNGPVQGFYQPPNIDAPPPAPIDYPQQTLQPRTICSYPGCDRSYARPGDCRRHMLKHAAGPSRFRCIFRDCDMGFQRGDKLREHLENGHKFNFRR